MNYVTVSRQNLEFKDTENLVISIVVTQQSNQILKFTSYLFNFLIFDMENQKENCTVVDYKVVNSSNLYSYYVKKLYS